MTQGETVLGRVDHAQADLHIYVDGNLIGSPRIKVRMAPMKNSSANVAQAAIFAAVGAFASEPELLLRAVAAGEYYPMIDSVQMILAGAMTFLEPGDEVFGPRQLDLPA
jgi:hypothetical protein